MTTVANTKSDRRQAQTLAMKARQNAIRELFSRHSEEWDLLLRHHRVALGLPAATNSVNPEKIKERIDKYQKLLVDLQTQLDNLEG